MSDEKALEKVRFLWEFMGMSFGQWIDAHSHLSDLRISIDLRRSWVKQAQALGIGFFVQGGVDPADWDRQVNLAKEFPGQIGLCFGLHPYFVARETQENCELALNQWSHRLHSADLAGEMGLDFRPQFAEPEQQDRQIDFFSHQLELSVVLGKPVVLHIVQAHEEALKVWDHYGEKNHPALVHSFNSSWEVAQEYLRRGLVLSFGGPLARPKNQKLAEVAKKVPLDSFVLETDAPDQPVERGEGILNPLTSIDFVAQAMAEAKGLTKEEVFELARQNFLKRLRPES